MRAIAMDNTNLRLHEILLKKANQTCGECESQEKLGARTTVLRAKNTTTAVMKKVLLFVGKLNRPISTPDPTPL
jgi:hypothetical protein